MKVILMILVGNFMAPGGDLKNLTIPFAFFDREDVCIAQISKAITGTMPVFMQRAKKDGMVLVELTGTCRDLSNVDFVK